MIVRFLNGHVSIESSHMATWDITTSLKFLEAMVDLYTQSRDAPRAYKSFQVCRPSWPGR